jgi:hypothetical protein
VVFRSTCSVYRGPVLTRLSIMRRSMIAATLRCSCAGRRGVTGCQSAGTKPCRMLRAFARGTSGRNRGTRTLVLTAATLAVLVAASQVGSAQAYSCDSDADCQYSPCNDQPCSSSSSHCVNGKWRAICVSCTPIPEAPRTILICVYVHADLRYTKRCDDFFFLACLRSHGTATYDVLSVCALGPNRT